MEQLQQIYKKFENHFLLRVITEIVMCSDNWLLSIMAEIRSKTNANSEIWDVDRKLQVVFNEEKHEVEHLMENQAYYIKKYRGFYWKMLRRNNE